MKKILLLIIGLLLGIYFVAWAMTNPYILGTSGPSGGEGGCSESPFIEQAESNDTYSVTACGDSRYQVLKASDVNGKTICKVCISIGYLDSSPYVFNITFDQSGQVGDASDNGSASSTGEICVEWSGTKPSLTNANANMEINTVSGSGRVNVHTDETKYQDTNYDFWCYWADSDTDLYMKVYAME